MVSCCKWPAKHGQKGRAYLVSTVYAVAILKEYKWEGQEKAGRGREKSGSRGAADVN